jgi:hypothetical protein
VLPTVTTRETFVRSPDAGPKPSPDPAILGHEAWIASAWESLKDFDVSEAFLGAFAGLAAMADPVVHLSEEKQTALIHIALNDILMNPSRPFSVVATLAAGLRQLTPQRFDTWVDQQMDRGCLLSIMMVRRMKGGVVDGDLQGKVDGGHLVVGLALGQPDRVIGNFVAILHEKLIADLGLKTLDEKMELDLALGNFVTARRLAVLAENYFATLPNLKDVRKGTKLLEEARHYDRIFQQTLDRLRARRTRAPAVQVVTKDPAAPAVQAVPGTPLAPAAEQANSKHKGKILKFAA